MIFSIVIRIFRKINFYKNIEPFFSQVFLFSDIQIHLLIGKYFPSILFSIPIIHVHLTFLILNHEIITNLIY